jgi:type I restriction enzyme S subunit
MKVPAYPHTKPSGVEWLGDVPAHWEVKRGRFVWLVNPPATRLRMLKPRDEVSFVPMEAVGVDGGLNLEQTRVIADMTGGYTEFQDGDVVVAKITPCFENGKAALATRLLNGAAYGTTELHVLRASSAIKKSFLFYVAISDTFRKIGESEMYGAGGQKRVPPQFCEDFLVSLPPLPEQRAIAAFLDRETGRIDQLVRVKHTLIERLREKRAALISRTVTRGLPPEAARAAGLPENPSLKPSGVAWLGDVPAQWQLVPIKQLLSAIVDTEHKTAPFYEDGEYLVARTPNIRDGKLIIENAKYTDESGYREWTARGKPKPGDILFTREAPAGEACLVPVEPPLCIGQRVVLFRTNLQQLDSRFAIYSIYGGAARTFIDIHSLGSTVTHFNMSEVAMIPMLTPALAEQIAIADYLDAETAKLDALAAKVEAAIERLGEYRTALITAAVTGKIDVRGTTVNNDNDVDVEAKHSGTRSTEYLIETKPLARHSRESGNPDLHKRGFPPARE